MAGNYTAFFRFREELNNERFPDLIEKHGRKRKLNLHPTNYPTIYQIPPYNEDLWNILTIIKYYGDSPLNIDKYIDEMPYYVYCALLDKIIGENTK